MRKTRNFTTGGEKGWECGQRMAMWSENEAKEESSVLNLCICVYRRTTICLSSMFITEVKMSQCNVNALSK